MCLISELLDMYKAAKTSSEVVSVQEQWLKQMEIEAALQRKQESKGMTVLSCVS